MMPSLASHCIEHQRANCGYLSAYGAQFLSLTPEYALLPRLERFVVPRISKLDIFQIASAQFLPRSPTARTRSPAPHFSGALAPAALLGLLALPAAAAGLDPAKVNADLTAQRTLEAIDSSHHLQPLGTLAHYVLAADAQGQTCTIEDKGNDILMMECVPSPQHPQYSLLLTGENGRLLAVSMYGADNHNLPTGDAFERLTAVAPLRPAPPLAPTATAEGNDMPLGSAAPQGSTLWAFDRGGRKISLGSVAELDAAVGRGGGKCTIARDPTERGAATMTCRSPVSRGTDTANELDLEVKSGTTDCLTGRDCYEVRDIKLNDRRLTQAQFLQYVARAAALMHPDPLSRKGSESDTFRRSLPHSIDLDRGTNAATRFWASDVDNHKQDLLGTAELLSTVERKGGRCVIGPALDGSGSMTGADGSPSQIVCRFPKAANTSPDAADELVLEASFSYRDCLRGGRNCYEIRDISLNDERLTSAQYLQLVKAPVAPTRVAPPDLPGGMPIAEGTAATTIFRAAAGHDILLGRPWDLDALVRQGGGTCAMTETKEGQAETICRFPDPQTRQVHELDIHASYSILGMPPETAAYDVSSIMLDGRPLPYADYRRTFVDRK